MLKRYIKTGRVGKTYVFDSGIEILGILRIFRRSLVSRGYALGGKIILERI
jgi:hypothetical protein